jgi:hypothetical protein
VVLQANISRVGGGVLSFDFGRARMKYKHLEKVLSICGGGPFILVK